MGVHNTVHPDMSNPNRACRNQYNKLSIRLTRDTRQSGLLLEYWRTFCGVENVEGVMELLGTLSRQAPPEALARDAGAKSQPRKRWWLALVLPGAVVLVVAAGVGLVRGGSPTFWCSVVVVPIGVVEIVVVLLRSILPPQRRRANRSAQPSARTDGR